MRYSISFRNIIPDTSIESSTTETEKSVTGKSETTLIFGSSISKGLNEKKLAGKSDKLPYRIYYLLMCVLLYIAEQLISMYIVTG